MRHLIAAAALLALAACASEPKPTVVASAAAPATAASGPKMVCHPQQMTGSHFTQNVCEPEQQDNSRTQEVARSWVEQNTRLTSPTNTSATH